MYLHTIALFVFVLCERGLKCHTRIIFGGHIRFIVKSIIDGAEPTGQTVSLVVSVVFMLIVVSVTHIVRGKQYRQLCSQQSGSPY